MMYLLLGLSRFSFLQVSQPESWAQFSSPPSHIHATFP